MKRGLAVALAALGALSLTACQEAAVKVPGAHTVMVLDLNGNIDQSHINAACLSSGVKAVHYFTLPHRRKGAFVECR